MRFLNKIIFLNSAHIPYTEVKLDGNVHFIGTQGVGKSTLLRAVLFFYNADKLKLGIPKEKKSFDVFYFPYPNSYIVYEVKREEGAFCVVALKSQGRTMFRFIDAPYQREWFVNERGEVPAEWARVRERIGKAHYSTPLIEFYDRYRDIIYGNNKRKELRDYARFCLFESSQYQNIPRTIQNVFLNSKLDADFIKDTIIHSMNNEEVAVKLEFYRNQIKDFEQEYKDVKLWSDQKRNGEVPVRKIANEVIESYYSLLHTQQKIEEERCELMYAENAARQLLPQLEQDLYKNKEGLNLLDEKISDENQKYKKEYDESLRQLGSLEDKLHIIAQKKKSYEKLNIQSLIQRVEQEELLKDELTNRQHEREDLTREQQNIVDKYRLLQDKATHDFERFTAEKEALANKRRFDSTSAEKELLLHRYNQEDKLRKAENIELTEIREEHSQWQEKFNELKRRKLQLQYQPPFQEEIKECQQALKDFDTLCIERKNQIRILQTEVTHLRKESEFEADKLRQKTEHELDKTEILCEKNQKEKEDISHKLEQHKNSLSAWLDNNKPDWKQNIGKVVNEDKLLYADNLQPRLVDLNHTSLYGIELDLSQIECMVLSPEDLRRKRAELEKQAELYQQHKIGLRQQLEVDIQHVQKPFSDKVNELLDKQRMLEQEQLQENDERNTLQVNLINWEKKREEKITEKTQAFEAEEQDLIQKTTVLKEREKAVHQTTANKIQACLHAYEEEVGKLKQELLIFCQQNEKEVDEHRKALEQQIKDFKKAEQDELKGNGVDMNFLTKIDEAIHKLEKELQFIYENRKHVIRYEGDKAEWLDHESDFKLEKDDLENKSKLLEEHHETTTKALFNQKNELKVVLQKLNEDRQRTHEELAAVRNFKSDTFYCPPTDIIREPKTTSRSCRELVTELSSMIGSTGKKENVFKKQIHEFNGFFSPKNTFHFNQELSEDKDYYTFAAKLSEFIENNMIADFENQISRRYIDIIRNLAREMALLTSHESEIEKIISAINRDFVERNFAGVIKQIALRTQPGSDKLVQLLMQIKKFYDENEFNLGEADLFHQGSKDDIHAKTVKYLLSFAQQLIDNPTRQELTLSDTFKLEFRIQENDNDTGWTEKIANVGSDGTDILVKAMVNIMLINVFKEKASRKRQEFRVHCMMDEIGKLHPTNVKGILDFANCRNILLVNCSPTSFNAGDYKYTYLLRKDSRANTSVIPLLAKQENQEDGKDQ